MYAGDEDFPPWRTPFAKSHAEAHNPGTHLQDLNLGYGRQATGDRGRRSGNSDDTKDGSTDDGFRENV